MGRWQSGFDLYRARDSESARVRAVHLSALTRQTPALMAANLANALLLLAALDEPVSGPVIGWLAALTGLVGLSLWRSRRRGKASPTTASARAFHRATLHAAVLAGLWSVPPLAWFGGGSAGQQMLTACVTIGMLAGGAFALHALPWALLAYVAVLVAASLGGLLLDGQAHALLLVPLLLIYGLTLAVAGLEIGRKATALVRAEYEAARQGQMVSLLLRDFEDHAVEALWETGRDGHLTHASPRLADLLGATAAALAGRPLLGLLRERGVDAGPLQAAFAAGRPFRGLRVVFDAADGPRWWSLAGKPLFDDAGRGAGWRGVIDDVTDEVRAGERLHRLAHVDALTGLANRLTLHEALRSRLATGLPGALLAVDLDRFKAINDSLGHSSGDAVLRAVATRLAAAVRPGDVVARLGGDEFAVLAMSVDDEPTARAMATRIVAALELPIDHSDRQLRVGASVGVALLRVHGADIDELLVHADLALYQAKAEGRGRAVVYHGGLGARSRRRALIEEGLRSGLAQGQFDLRWQPQVDLGSRRVVGAEALLRWRHPTLGAVSPAEFVPLAEQTGQIQALGAWVLRHACQAAAGPLRGLTVSVNVSAVQLGDGAFEQVLRDALLATRADPASLELEITESVFLCGVDGAIERLQALRQLGVRLALDDFGTGYSSLAYLRRFHFDTLKIDRAFVAELLQPAGDAMAIVRSIVHMAHQLGMRTIAEGVENEAQLAAVVRARCDHVQGYVVSRPCTLEDFMRRRDGWGLRADAAVSLH